MDKERILCFAEHWSTGGIEAFITSCILNMPSDAGNVDVVAARISDSPFTERLKERGVRFFSLSGKLHSRKNLPLFKKLLKENKYRAAHFNVFHCLALGYARAARDAGIPVRIVHAHGSGLRRSPATPLKLLLHRMCRRLWLGCETARLACSRSASEFFFGDGSATVIGNGIDTERFRFDPAVRERVREELSLGNSPTVGHVGRMSSEKNQEFLLRVFAEYVKANGSARLLLVGDGDDMAKNRALAEELSLGDSVIFYGNSDRVEELMCAMDVFVFPSLFEGFGIVAVEAQASGLGLLKSAGVPDGVSVSDRVITLSLDAELTKWAEAIGSLLTTPADRLSGAEAVKKAGYDAASVARRVRDFYFEKECDR